MQKSVEDWSPDGKLILFNSVGAVWAAPIQGGRNPFLVLEGPRSDQSKLSPDGHWIAYRSSESGRDEVYVQGFPVAGAKWQISTAGGMEPNWRRDVKEMYFTNDNKLMAVDVKGTAGGFEHGAPRVLFDAPFAWEIRRNRYVPASDGQRFLVLTTGEEGAASPIHVVLNGKSEVKR